MPLGDGLVVVDTSTLSAKEEKVAELYATAGRSPREIAAETGIADRTVYKILRKPLVRALVADLRGRELRPVVDWIRSRLMAALQVYADVIADPGEPTRNRLAAADSLCAQFHRFWGLSEIQPRLAELEAAADRAAASEG